MLYQGVMISQASGRLADSVWSHNQGGYYVRALGNPNPNPATTEQEAIRAAMAVCVNRWKTALTPEQRSTWAAYAAAFPRTNRIGVDRTIGGMPAFCRANVLREQANQMLGTGLTLIDTAPAAGSDTAPSAPPYTLELTNGGDRVFVGFNPGASWYNEADAALLVYASPPLPLTVNWYRSPMTLVYAVQSFDDNPTLIVLPDAQPADRRVFRLRVLRADGVISQPAWWKVDL